MPRVVVYDSLKRLLTKVISLKSQVGPVISKNAAFRLDVFWMEAESSARVLSNGFTQLALAYSREERLEEREVDGMMCLIDAALDNLITVFRYAPENLGFYFNKKLWSCVSFILIGMESFLETLITPDNCCVFFRVKLALQPVGVFWNAIEKVSELPRNNFDAVFNSFQTECALLKDAVEEISSTLNEQKHIAESGVAKIDDEWSPADLSLAQEVNKLARLTYEFLNLGVMALRRNGKADLPQQIQDLDKIGNAVFDKFSESMDNIVTTLYPPLDGEALNKYLSRHFELIKEYNSVLIRCHFMREENKRLAGLIFQKILGVEVSLSQCIVTKQLDSLAIEEPNSQLN